MLSLGDANRSSQKQPPTLHIDDQLDRILSGSREKISDSEEEGESYSDTKLGLVLTHKTQSNTKKRGSQPNTASSAEKLSSPLGQADTTPLSGLSDLKSLPPLTSSRLSSSNKSPLLTSVKSLPVPTQEKQKILSSSKRPTLFDTELPESYGDDYEEDDDDSLQRPVNAKEHKNVSLSQEVLSELSEELSSLSEEGPLQPLMSSDALKTIEDLQVVSSEEDDQMAEDFNQMTETDYEKRKAQMEEEFQRRRIKPGDLDFVYDKQVDFDTGVKIESGWDNSDSSTSEF